MPEHIYMHFNMHRAAGKYESKRHKPIVFVAVGEMNNLESRQTRTVYVGVRPIMKKALSDLLCKK